MGDPHRRLTELLSEIGPVGVFLRFLLAQARDPSLFDTDRGAVLGGDHRSRIPVVSPWLVGDPAGAHDLLQIALHRPSVEILHVAAPIEVSPPQGWASTIDRVLIAEPTQDPGEARVLSGPDVLEALDRIHPELAPLIPPPPLRERLPFRFHALMQHQQIVSLCDTTVADGQWVAIQQVRTVAALRGQGLARRLCQGARAAVYPRSAVWVCDEANLASVATARAAGFAPLVRIPFLHRTGVRVRPELLEPVLVLCFAVLFVRDPQAA